MEQVQWVECCNRYEALWRTARVSDETSRAWFEEFGRWADYALAMRAISRLSTDHDRGPSLATWREMHGAMLRERAADQKRDRGEPVADGPGSASWERRKKLGDEWLHVNDCLHDKLLAAMFEAMRKGTRKPGEPTDAEGHVIREALIDEIAHRMAQGAPIERIPRGDPRRRKTAPTPEGELAPVGESL